MRKYKVFAILLAMAMVFTLMVGCKKDDPKPKEETKKVEKSEEKKDEKKDEKEDTSEDKKEEEDKADTESHSSDKADTENVDLVQPKEDGTYTRVVAGTVAVAEMLDVLGFDAVVGVPNSHYPLPERYKDAAQVGRPMEPDLEKVLSLEPDLLVSVSSLKESNEAKFNEQGVETIFLENDSFDAMLDSILILGKKVGKEAEAKAFVEKQKAVVEKILSDNKDVEPKKVLFLFGSPKAIMVGTQHSYVGSLLKKIGVINIADQFPEIKGSYAPLNLEEVVKAEPEMILRMTHASPEEAQAMFEKEFGTNEIWQGMTAVKEGKVYDLDIHTFGVSGNIHIEEAFNQLEEILFK